jgi:hypothetical protein
MFRGRLKAPSPSANPWRKLRTRPPEDRRSRALFGYGYRKRNITFDNTKVHSETICANEARVRLVGNPYAEIGYIADHDVPMFGGIAFGNGYIIRAEL